MKKILIIVLILICSLFLLMLNLISDINNDNKKLDKIAVDFKLKNKVINIKDIYYYADKKTYIILKYQKDTLAIF